MPNTTKSNKLKRKRGKKFVWHGSAEGADKGNKPGGANASKTASNPFEDHEKTQKLRRDESKRKELLNEYNRLNKNSQLTDNRIGESSSKLSLEDKMKLRYMREQRDRAKQAFLDKDKEIESKKDAAGGSLSTK